MMKVMMMTGRNDVARFGAHNEEEEEDECFFESLDRVLSSCSCSTSNSDYDSDPSAIHDPNPFPLPSGFDLWKSEPESVSERRIRLLRGLGLSNEPDLAPASRLRRRKGIRSSHFARSSHHGKCVSSLRSDVVVDHGKLRCSLNDHHRSNGNNVVLDFVSKDPIETNNGRDVVLEEKMCTIKNLDNGKEFVVNEVREDGVLEKLKEVGTDRQLTLEEFEIIDGEEEEDECFFESLDRVLSSCSCSTSNSDYDSDPSAIHDPNPFPLPSGFDLWKSEPESVSERRIRLLRGLGLSNEPDLAPASRLRRRKGIRSSHFARSSHHGKCVSSLRSDVVVDHGKLRCSLNDHHRSNGNNVVLDFVSKDPIETNNGRDVVLEEKMCTIKNLDNGKEFVVNEVREDGVLEKLKEVGTDRQLTLEEFEMCAGTSPIVLELMRRQNVEDVCKDSVDLSTSVSGTKHRRKGSWFKSIKSVASSVTGYKERRSTDDRDSPSERGGQRLSSATDDSRDVTFQDPERVKVRQYGKACKELTALFKSQEIDAHKGSIWSIKFSLDGRYLASAGEDCVIQIWEVVESERKGELLLVDKQDDGGEVLFQNNEHRLALELSSSVGSSSPSSYSFRRLVLSESSRSSSASLPPATDYHQSSVSGHLGVSS
ncbi:hypothetical protein F2Q69_00001254 [Brassica cretica]|uniref:Transducin/WD40 repeat-like superfamily protein n=1 Tax=Brassica cretica TaxID=69181 RepID=A0A8S9P2A2_BRACR|nr:hypothetical protein F2Q69_00001254 [Brassica cretica]